MPTEVVILFSPDVSGFVRGKDEGVLARDAAASVTAILERFGATLAPVHSDSTDADLDRYFNVVAASSEEAEAIARALHGLDGVEAAYVKPLPSMP